MPLNGSGIGARTEPVEHGWTAQDTMLYALSVGATPQELALVTENSQGTDLTALPTMIIPVSTPIPMFDGQPDAAIWGALGGIDWSKVVHGEQYLRMHQPLPAEGRLSAVSEITSVLDKGSAAVVTVRTDCHDVGTGAPLATSTAVLFIRGGGGFRTSKTSLPLESPSVPTAPSQADAVAAPIPDAVVEECTLPTQALLYRLVRDRNPLHSDPVVARRAGFDVPILQGLCTFGFAARAIVAEVCDGDPSRLTSISARFSAPVRPGDPLTTELWLSGDRNGSFVTKGLGNVPVLTRGSFDVRSR